MSKNLKFKISSNVSSWVEIGEVKYLHVYPLSSCQPIQAEKVQICQKGITLNENMWDNMFVIYNDTTKCIYNNSNARLSIVEVKFLVKDKVEMSMHDTKLTLDLAMIKENEQVKCIQLVDGKYIAKKKFYDCGQEANVWFSDFLDDPHARLGYFYPPTSSIKLEDCLQWLYPSFAYANSRNMNIPALPTCRVMSQETFLKIKDNTDDYVRLEDYNPNIIMTTGEPFKEDEIEWIKIGKTIMRTFRPCLRSPNEKTFHIPVEMRMQLLSLYCESYIPGEIKLGDKVYGLICEFE